MSKPNLLVMGHGKIAVEALNSAYMIAGEIEGATSFEMTAEEGSIGLEEKLDEYFKTIPEDKKIIVLADLFGGTPSNVAFKYLNKKNNIELVTGFNLGMILTYAFSQETDINKLVTEIINGGKSGITNHNINSINSDINDFDDEVEID